MPTKELQYGTVRWIHIDNIGTETVSYLRNAFRFHDRDLEHIQKKSQTSKMNAHKNYIYTSLQFPHWDAQQQTVSAFTIHFFVGSNYIISVQHAPSNEVKQMFHRCLTNKQLKKEWMGKGTGYLLSHIIESLHHQAGAILNNIGKRIAQIDQPTFSQGVNDNSTRSLTAHQKNILGFRRIIDSQRPCISTLAQTRKHFFAKETAASFSVLYTHLNTLCHTLDTHKDTIQRLRTDIDLFATQRKHTTTRVLVVALICFLFIVLVFGIKKQLL